MKKLVFFIVIILSLTILSGCNNEEATAEVEGEAKTLAEVKEDLASKRSELEEIEPKLESTSEELEANQSDLKELKELKNDSDNLKKEVDDNESVLAELKVDISIAESELSDLKGKIEKADEEPIKLNAGYYYFGEDIPQGRYELMPQEGYRGNIYVNDTDGRGKVIETFGSKGEHVGLDSFIFYGYEGEEIEAKIPFILQPVE